MDLKLGQKVAVVNVNAIFRSIEGMEGYIGVGTYLGEFEDENGTVSKKVKLDALDIVLTENENSNVKFFDVNEYLQKALNARIDIEKKQQYLYVQIYELENAAELNRKR